MELENYVLAAKLRIPRHIVDLKKRKHLIVKFTHHNGCYEAYVYDGTYELIKQVEPKKVSTRSFNKFYKDTLLEIKYGEIPDVELSNDFKY